MQLHTVGLAVFFSGIGLIIIGLILCCFWVKEADSSRKYRKRREEEAEKTRPRFGSNVVANRELLSVPPETVSTS